MISVPDHLRTRNGAGLRGIAASVRGVEVTESYQIISMLMRPIVMPQGRYPNVTLFFVQRDVC